MWPESAVASDAATCVSATLSVASSTMTMTRRPRREVSTGGTGSLGANRAAETLPRMTLMTMTMRTAFTTVVPNKPIW